MGGVDCLIFSKDRGCQLDLLLRSIDRYASHIYSSLSILYTASSRDFHRGYAICFSEHAGPKFILETSFEAQVRKWLSLTDGPVSFLVDDDVFYDYPPEILTLARGPVSLRGGDYDYLFSVDGNIYRVGDITELLRGLSFRDPTELEIVGHEHESRLSFDTLVPCDPPCLVGVPLNRVSRSSGMPSMGVHEYDLNERYLAGERLALPIIGKPLPAHAALELAFA